MYLLVELVTFNEVNNRLQVSCKPISQIHRAQQHDTETMVMPGQQSSNSPMAKKHLWFNLLFVQDIRNKFLQIIVVKEQEHDSSLNLVKTLKFKISTDNFYLRNTLGKIFNIVPEGHIVPRTLVSLYNKKPIWCQTL